jgi:hypothetical protein
LAAAVSVAEAKGNPISGSCGGSPAVTGESATSDGVLGISTSGVGVTGSCGSGIGVLGYSAGGPCIVSQGNSVAPGLIAFGNYEIIPPGGTAPEPAASMDSSGGVLPAAVAALVKSNPGYAAVLSGKVLVTDALQGTAGTFSGEISGESGLIGSAGLMVTGNIQAFGSIASTGENITAAGSFISGGNGFQTASGNFTTQTGNISAFNAVLTGTLIALDVVLTGADCAEQFDAVGPEAIEPGTVLVIDDCGALQPCRKAYDRRVAGVVSGAGSFRPGIVLDRRADSSGRATIALVGKVFCKVNADYEPIGVGDLLTTSPTPGHAMRTADPRQAFGSVIGKALAGRDEGCGLIPILVALQ